MQYDSPPARKRLSYDDAVRLAENMPEAFQECRDERHDLRKHGRPVLLDGGAHERIRRCVRCGSIRYQVIDRHGFLVSTKWEYADNYVLKGAGRFTSDARAAIRLAGLHREIGDTEADGTPRKRRGARRA